MGGICLCIYIYIYICIFVYVYSVLDHAYRSLCLCVCVYVYVPVSVCVCVCVCVLEATNVLALREGHHLLHLPGTSLYAADAASPKPYTLNLKRWFRQIRV